MTPKGCFFEHILSGNASGMTVSTPPLLIATMLLPQENQIQLQLKFAVDTEGIFDGYSYKIGLYQYQLVLDKSVDYPVKISGTIETRDGTPQYATLLRRLATGQLIDLKPGVPQTVVGLTYQYSRPIATPVDFKLMLNIHLNMSTTGPVAHMRSHVEQLGSLLSLGNFADCKVVSNDGHFYDCHKALLCLKSEVFQRAFEAEGMIEAKLNEIKIDCDSMIADLIIPHFYIGQMPKITKETAMELYRLAHLYHIEGLRAYLAEEMIVRVNQLLEVANVLEFTIFADKFDLKVFQQLCLMFMFANRCEVVKLPQWKEFRSDNPSMIDQLLSL